MPPTEILRVVFGFVAVLGMIGVCAYGARKAGLASLPGAAGNKRRLAISEMLPLDARRRLALIRCDDAEYLVILGPAGETLIAGGIEAPSIENAGTVAPAEAPIAGLAALADKLRAANILPRGNKDAA